MIRRALRSLEPPPEIGICDWAAENIIIPGRGPWDPDFAPYHRGILEAFDDPTIEEVVCMKPTQAGLSLDAGIKACKHIATDPCEGMFAQPTEDDLKDFYVLKLNQLIQSSPAIKRLVREGRRGQAGGSITTRIMFPGGFLQGAAAHSANSLQSKSIRLLIGDEIDEWPIDSGGGGDPLDQAIARTRTFWNRKIILFGKPKLAKNSRIARLYHDSDQRKWLIPCVSCKLDFLPTWTQIRWEDDKPETALLHCSHCEHGHNDSRRLLACRLGKWVAHNPGHRRAGFHFPSWITPWVRDLGGLVAKWLEANRAGPERRQVFFNSERAETWNEAGDQLDPASLEAKAEAYTVDPLPAGVVAITMGSDVQADRIESVVVGWGAGHEAWVLAYHRHPGSPDTPEPWADVDALRATRWNHPYGFQLPIEAVCIDSGGHHTQSVYQYCSPRANQRVYAIKGQGGKIPIWAKLEKRRNIKSRGQGHPVHRIGVDTGKESLYWSLKKREPGPGYLHLGDFLEPEFYEQLTSEERTLGRKGLIVWVATGRPNEVWDCLNYARGAIESRIASGLSLDRLAAQRAALYAQRGASQPPPPSATLQPRKRMLSYGLNGPPGR